MINLITRTCLFFISEAFISQSTLPFCVRFHMLMLSEGWSTFINNQPLFWEISIITAEIYHSAFSSLNMPALMSDWDSRAIHSDIKLMEQPLPRIVLRELWKCVPFLLFLHWFIRYTLEWVNAEASLAISTRDMSLCSRWAAQHLWPPGIPMRWDSIAHDLHVKGEIQEKKWL